MNIIICTLVHRTIPNLLSNLWIFPCGLGIFFLRVFYKRKLCPLIFLLNCSFFCHPVQLQAIWSGFVQKTAKHLNMIAAFLLRAVKSGILSRAPIKRIAYGRWDTTEHNIFTNFCKEPFHNYFIIFLQI